MNSRFVQVHFLTSYPASLLNRDDVGFAKRLPFGGSVRTRISSQCLKRHWRTYQGAGALAELDVAPSIRSRITFERFILQPLINEGVDGAVATIVTQALKGQVLGESVRAKKTTEGEEAGATSGVRTGQITVLGRPEVEFLLAEAREICKKKPKNLKAATEAVEERFEGDAKENLKSLRHASGLDAALFGRMVTSDLLARGDAAVHVAHAFTVHEEETESDYFSAVDDLLAADDEKGSGHIGNAELTSGLYYGYVVVDVPLLVSNLEGCDPKDWLEVDRKLAAGVLERLVQLVATVSPGAKLGSTAPHSYAHLVLVETGASQPRTLANAFLTPVSARPDLLENTYRALAHHLSDFDKMYGETTERRVAGIGPIDLLKAGCGPAESLQAIAEWAGTRVTAGR